MNSLTIFLLQFLLSLGVFTYIGKVYFAPRLSTKTRRAALILLILPHAFRHLGLSFLEPSLVNEELSSTFAQAAGYGDFLSGLLAILALVALHNRHAIAYSLVWIFNIIGTLDLVNALGQADAVSDLSTTWYIPTFFVPLLLVTHVMIFQRLKKTSSSNITV